MATVTTAASPTLQAPPPPVGSQLVPSPTQPPAGSMLAYGIRRRTTVKPDPERPYAEVELIDIDPTLLQVKMIPGTAEPQPTTGLIGTGVIPMEDRASLVASFNGGFAAMHGAYGMMVDRKVYLPARSGIATLAVYEDGSIRMGTWGTDLVQTPDMISYRQNCPPLIEHGVITAETGKLTLWGLSVSNAVYLYRSGLGMTAGGHLIYAAGKSLSAYTLARALQAAGAVYAMQLDVNEYHVAFITYSVQTATDGGTPIVTGQKLRDDMHGFDSFFLRPWPLDFFYLLRRPSPLANPVRFPATTTEAARSTKETGIVAGLPGQLAFASDRGGSWDLYTLRPGQPATLRRLTQDPAGALYPSWKPGGTALAFTSRRGGNSNIYIMDIQTLAIGQMTRLPSEQWAPAWSPGGVIAYQSDRNGQSDIYLASPDRSGETRLTQWQGNNEAPHWSPDGKQIVFDSDLDVAQPVHASINVYIMNSDGSNPHRIADHGESPAWSPDGNRIAFQGLRGGHWQICVVNPDGSGYRQLTTGDYDPRYATWSPDGHWLAFAGDRDGHWELFVMPVDAPPPDLAGLDYPLRLTTSAGDSSYPAWGP